MTIEPAPAAAGFAGACRRERTLGPKRVSAATPFVSPPPNTTPWGIWRTLSASMRPETLIAAEATSAEVAARNSTLPPLATICPACEMSARDEFAFEVGTVTVRKPLPARSTLTPNMSSACQLTPRMRRNTGTHGTAIPDRTVVPA